MKRAMCSRCNTVGMCAYAGKFGALVCELCLYDDAMNAAFDDFVQVSDGRCGRPTTARGEEGFTHA